MKAQRYDAIVVGGGAAGLMAAISAAQRGKRVLVLEVSNKFGKKILMSGGGRCNFTNMEVLAEHFLSGNPHFVKSALAQYSQWDFLALVSQHGIPYHEKQLGQLFCDNSSKDILQMLLAECDTAGVTLMTDCDTSSVEYREGYSLTTSRGLFTCSSLIVATGGLSIPSLGGATGFAYRVARQFELEITERCPSLVPFTLTGELHEISQTLSGISTDVVVSVPSKSFAQSLLFTHRGLSGPSILQISNYWHLGEEIVIDLLPQVDAAEYLLEQKHNYPNAKVHSVLSKLLPKALVDCLRAFWWRSLTELPLQQWSKAQCQDLGRKLNAWVIKPSGTEGYRTAEVTKGGIDVKDISSRTMAVKHQPNLFFIGEALDVTGHLGGYNFQWAWSSGYVAGKHC